MSWCAEACQMPCSWPLPTLCIGLVMRQGDLLDQDSSLCLALSVQGSLVHGAAEPGGLPPASLPSHNQEPSAISPPTPSTRWCEPRLCPALHPSPLHENCPCLHLREAGAGTYFYGFFSV